MLDTEAFLKMLRERDPATLDAEEKRVLEMADRLDAKRAEMVGWLQEWMREHPDDWQSPFKPE